MLRVRLSAHGRTDLDEIFDYLVVRSPTAAERTIERIVDRLKVLRDQPLAGHPRDEVRPGLRSLRCGEYVILHRVLIDRVEIMRIVHRSRDLAALPLNPPSP